MIKLELKVCEGCGGLYTRPIQNAMPYCPRCRVRLATAPDPREAVVVPGEQASRTVRSTCPRCLTGLDDNHDGDCGLCASLTDSQCAGVRAAILANQPQPEHP